VLTGTFINRNTAAVYFGVCAILWLLRLLRGISGPTFRVHRYQLSGLIQSGGTNQVTLNFAAFTVLLSATFMTGSRAGSLLFTSISLGVLMWAFWRTGRSPWYALLGGAVLLVALMAIVGAGVAGRVAAEGLVDSARVSVYRSVLRLIADHPWWGTGLGTFPSIFPSYRPGDISSFGIWDRAHSTPLELAAEQGIPFALLVVVMVGLIFVRLMNGVRRRREGRIFPLCAIAALALAATHSLVDFSLQIPGLTIVVLGVVGVGLAQSADPEQGGRNVAGASKLGAGTSKSAGPVLPKSHELPVESDRIRG
jgi:O-antigen ligase